jgi:uncharacterized protein YegP (UPF0339 family)
MRKRKAKQAAAEVAATTTDQPVRQHEPVKPPKPVSLHIEVFQSPADDQYYIRLRSTNGKIQLSSEGYKTKHNGKRAAERLADQFLGCVTVMIKDAAA